MCLTEIARPIRNVYAMETVERVALEKVSIYFNIMVANTQKIVRFIHRAMEGIKNH